MNLDQAWRMWDRTVAKLRATRGGEDDLDVDLRIIAHCGQRRIRTSGSGRDGPAVTADRRKRVPRGLLFGSPSLP